MLLQRNYRSILDSVGERGLLTGGDDVVYLFLPLAHAFALLISARLGRHGHDRRLLRR